jgi:hypothetical protein
VFRWSERITCEDLHLALLLQGFPRRGYELSNCLGQLLPGLLSLSGVGPGSCVVCKPLGHSLGEASEAPADASDASEAGLFAGKKEDYLSGAK